MYSFGIAQNILKATFSEAEKHKGKRVEAIRVKVDERDFMEADAVGFCLHEMTKGTIAEGAEIQIELADINAPRFSANPLSLSLKLSS